MTKIPKKRGQLSLDEEKYIRENFNKLTIEQIAEHLNRNPPPIKKYIEKADIQDTDTQKVTDQLRHKLHAKNFWSEIKKQFDADSGELKYFEDV